MKPKGCVLGLLLGLALMFSGCGSDGSELPQPTITVESTLEVGSGCFWEGFEAKIQTAPIDTTIWTVHWVDADLTIEAGVAEPGEIGKEDLYIPTYQSTVVEIEAFAIHGLRDTAYVAKNGPEDFQYLWDVPGCEWLRDLAKRLE